MKRIVIQSFGRRKRHNSDSDGSQHRRRAIAQELQRIFLLFVGAGLAAFGYAVFQVPHNLAAGGLGGISIIINHFTGWPVGLLYLVMNLPLLAVGFGGLGRWRFVSRTLLAATLFSLFTDLFGFLMPFILKPFPLSDDLLLNTVYGGIMGGVGGGLIYRAGSTMGGTGIIGRLIQQKTGRPLSQVYLYTDGIILFLMGLFLGWQVALYGLLMLFINGLASDYTLEGPSTTRVAMIITDHPQEMTRALMETLGRGVSYWPVTGGYTGQTRTMITCTIYRPQLNDLKRLLAEVDPDAFMTVGVSHQAIGKGFMSYPGNQVK
jgi:uncharacterized membrane-anchored protein YitT (DUF2179 family)